MAGRESAREGEGTAKANGGELGMSNPQAKILGTALPDRLITVTGKLHKTAVASTDDISTAIDQLLSTFKNLAFQPVILII